MKPTFALDLSRDVIALLHRTSKGWYSVGEVGFDAPDLGDALDYLRKTALGLSPMGMATKIVLPASQILYIEVRAPGKSDADKRRQIAAALEGRTPYAIEDLVFDWSGSGPTVQVAVVARETLEEAEAFAVQNRLNPVSIVAIPEPGSFKGEVWFGPTTAAAGILAANETVERDREPVVILQRELPQPDASRPADPAPDLAPNLDGDPAEDLPGLEEALNADLPLIMPEAAAIPALDAASDAAEVGIALDAAPFTPELEDEVDSLPGGAAPAIADPVPVAAELSLEPIEAPVDAPVEEAPFAEVPAEDAEELEAALEDAAMQAALAEEILRKEMALQKARPRGRTAMDTLPIEEPAITAAELALPQSVDDGGKPDASALVEGNPDAALPPEEAPFADVQDEANAPAADDTSLAADDNAPLIDNLIDDVPPAPPSAAMVAFASRRAAVGGPLPTGALTAKRSGEAEPGAALVHSSPPPVRAAAPVVTATTPPPMARPAMPATARISPAKGATGLITAPKIPGTRTKPKGKLTAAEILPPARPGMPGARSALPPGGTFGTAKPRRNRIGLVFMVLVGLLLASLVVVAAWSSYLLVRNTTDPTTDTAVAALPDVEDEMLADMKDPEGMSEPLPEADEVVADGQVDAGALATETLDPTSLETDPLPLNLAEEEATDLPADTLPATLPATLTESVVTEPAPDTAVETDISVATAPVEDQDEIFLSAMDAPPPALDALALPTPVETLDTLPEAPVPPLAFGTVYQFDANGMLLPTAEGILSPDGVMLIAGQPPLLPPVRSDVAAAAAAAAKLAAPPDAVPGAASPEDASLVTGDGTDSAAAVLPDSAAPVTDATAAESASPVDPALAGARPRPRPEGLVPSSDDDAQLATDEDTSALASLRPLPRPASILVAASASRPADAAGLAPADLGAQGASLAAQAEAQLAAAMALEASDPSIVAISMRPVSRPRDFSNAVEAAVAAAARDPEPEAEIVEAAAAPAADLKPDELAEVDEPEVVDKAPSIPTKASVAKQATFANAINLSKMNLIGTYGTSSNRYALIRQSNGRYKKVKVGDKIDGGRVEAITETEVRYQKNGKLVALKMPKA